MLAWNQRINKAKCREIVLAPSTNAKKSVIMLPGLNMVDVELGFKTIIISAQAGKIGKEFVGREFDKKMIEEFKKLGVCPCGENGEFHTLVIDGPLFKRPIIIKKAETLFKKGFWEHYCYEIKEFE